MIQILVNPHTLDGIFIINMNRVRPVTVDAAHIDGIAHEEIIVEDIGHIPFKDGFHLLRRVIHIREGKNIVYGIRQRLLHSVSDCLF